MRSQFIQSDRAIDRSRVKSNPSIPLLCRFGSYVPNLDARDAHRMCFRSNVTVFARWRRRRDAGRGCRRTPFGPITALALDQGMLHDERQVIADFGNMSARARQAASRYGTVHPGHQLLRQLARLRGHWHVLIAAFPRMTAAPGKPSRRSRRGCQPRPGQAQPPRRSPARPRRPPAGPRNPGCAYYRSP